MEKIFFQKNKAYPAKPQRSQGFTLVETLIYTAIFVMLVSALAVFASNLNSSRLRAQIILEVNDQGTSIVRTVGQAIRNAQSINSPTIGNSASSISVATVNPATNPTVFSQIGETIYMTEGAGNPIPLSNSKVRLTNLTFTNLSRSSTPGVIKFSFTMQNTAGTSRAEEQYQINFYGSATIR